MHEAVAKASAMVEQARQRPQPATPQPPIQQPSDGRPGPDRNAWAAAMATVAQEYAADLAALPPHRKREASIKARALASSANSLLAGVDLEPYRLRT